MPLVVLSLRRAPGGPVCGRSSGGSGYAVVACLSGENQSMRLGLHGDSFLERLALRAGLVPVPAAEAW
ncbi:MAG TPA: hypothetical protein VK028_01935, partial [Micromonosporaceae bacterium]|nr:hypothetical protein [Micromonosporaceae bacterium]